jgi:hypothetical protein
MKWLRKNSLILVGAAAMLALGWLIVPSGRPTSQIGTSRPDVPTSITAQQVNREAHPSNLATRPGAAGSVPMAVRRATSDTCEGYNVELVEVAAIETRQGRHENAARLLGMRQNCAAGASEHHRSSLR